MPIVGQPAQILGWSATFFVECSCGERLILAGRVGMGAGCPKCRRAVIVKGFRTNGPRLDVDLQFAMMAPEPEPEPEDAPLG